MSGPGAVSFAHYDAAADKWQPEIRNISHVTAAGLLSALVPTVVVGVEGNVWVTWENL